MFVRFAMFARTGLPPLVVVTFCMCAASLHAQVPGTESSVAKAALSSIQGQNSASQYTVNRVNRDVINRSIPRVGVRGVNQQNFVAGSGALANQRGSKPFSMIDRGPTVSPYLQLSNPLSTASDYYNVVKPLQEQRNVNDRLMRQQYAQSRKLNQMAAQGPYQITGNDEAAPTGHSTGFMKYGSYMNLGGYFAPQTAPKQQGQR
jgi:hypothetical protein